MSASRISSLDGLRAVSILSVILAHAIGTRGFPTVPVFKVAGDLGNLGVRCFFVISGFLITHLLIQEARATGGISLKAFYIRRTFRIFPAFYAFMASVAVLSAAGIATLRSPDLIYAATYTINFIGQKSWVIGHAWSLAVEEQFYLLWPLCIVALGWHRARGVAWGAICLAPVFRIGAWYLLPEYRGIITKAFPTICDTIATGCVLACLRERLWDSQRYRSFLGSRAFILVPMLVLLSNSLASHTRPDLLVGHSVRNIGLALIIDWCLRHPLSRAGQVLNSRPMVWIGTLSYSLYLWQQIFLNRSSDAVMCSFPLNVALAFMLASVSYYAVERPCLRARACLFPGATPAAKAPERRATTAVPASRAAASNLEVA